MTEQMASLGPCETPKSGWTCFHCGETLYEVEEARLHFGNDICDEPGCIIKLRNEENDMLKIIRELLAEIDRYRLEDQPNMREYYTLGGEHQKKLMQVEEEGYEKGLKDGQEQAEKVTRLLVAIDAFRTSMTMKLPTSQSYGDICQLHDEIMGYGQSEKADSSK